MIFILIISSILLSYQFVWLESKSLCCNMGIFCTKFWLWNIEEYKILFCGMQVNIGLCKIILYNEVVWSYVRNTWKWLSIFWKNLHILNCSWVQIKKKIAWKHQAKSFNNMCKVNCFSFLMYPCWLSLLYFNSPCNLCFKFILLA